MCRVAGGRQCGSGEPGPFRAHRDAEWNNVMLLRARG